MILLASSSFAQDITYCQTPVRKEIDYNGWKVSREIGFNVQTFAESQQLKQQLEGSGVDGVIVKVREN